MKQLKTFDLMTMRLLFVLFSFAYLAVAMHLPVSIYTYASHDDALFISNAYQIVKGNWLGVYNEMTLVKGVGFSLFLAVNAVLGTPVTLLIALLYLFACSLTVFTLYKLGLSRYLLLIIFVVMLFHPHLFPTRIIRDNIYYSLTLIILSGIIWISCLPIQKDRLIIKIVPYGLVFGLFWLTREEGIWIIPGVILLIVLKAIKSRNQNLAINELFRRVAIFSIAAMAPIILIASINYHMYGKFEVVDFKGEAFSHALKSLYSVKVGADIPYVPVPYESRQAIYKVSPTFSQLKKFFEEDGKSWSSDGCRIYPWSCGDYAGGWFAFALRNAVALNGHYENPVKAAEFYRSITNEIEKACDDGLLTCESNPIPLMPNITANQLKELPKKIYHALELAMVQTSVSDTGGPSWEPLSKLKKVKLFLGNPKATLSSVEETIELSGWFHSPDDEWVALSCMREGLRMDIDIDRMASPDIATHFNDSKADYQRFQISIPKNDDCGIISTATPRQKSLQIMSILNKKNGAFSVGVNGTLYLDSIEDSNIYSAHPGAVKVKRLLVDLYKYVIPLIVFLGALAYMSSLVLTLVLKTRFSDVFIVSSMFWCLFFSRVTLLALVDVSSFPAVNALYMQPAFPILCLASLMSLQLIFVRVSKHQSLK